MTGTPDLIAGFKALDATRDAYLLRWAYYAGTLPERFASERIQQLVERSADTQYRFRFAKVPINVMRNRVQLAAVTGATEAITARIETIRRANDMDMIEPFMHERLFTYGDIYALSWPVDTEDGAVPAELREAGVSITYQSPLSVRAMYSTEDGTDLRYVIRRWKVSDPAGDVWHAELYYPNGTIEPWKCQPGANGTDAISWEPDAEDADGEPIEWPIQHEYGMPITHGRTSLPYGRPEHADAMGPQDALTKLILTQTVVDLEAHGWPERWELIKSQNPDMARDAVPWNDNAEAPPAPKNGVATGRRGGPGTRHVLEGRDATGEYSSPNPGELVPVSDQWLRFMSVVTETPAYEYDPAGNAGLSGVARMWADRPAAARERNLKRFLLRFYRQMYGKALEMVGIADPGLIDVKWEPPGVINDPDWWEVATVRRDHGVPQKVILTEANYPPEQVEEWLDEDDEARTLLQRITMVEKLGTALQTLGSAVALGVIDQARVDTLVSKILGERVIEQEPVEPPAPAVLPAAVPPREIER